MNNLATLASAAIHDVRASAGSPEPLQVSPVIRKLFMVLHGSYGNLFISKFSTGEKDSAGRDKGIRAAMKVWEAALGKFSADVVETAAGRLTKEHPEFAPNLPQFEKLCDAAAPRQTYSQEQGLVALPAPEIKPVSVSVQRRDDGKDWARRILARIEAGDKSVSRYAHDSAKQAMGLMGKQKWH